MERNRERAKLTTYEGMIMENTGDITKSSINMNNPVMVIDLDICEIVRVGDAFTSDIKTWFAEEAQRRIIGRRPEESNMFRMIEFDRYDGALDIEEICTMINYLYYAGRPGLMKEIVEADIDWLKASIKEWQELGF